MSGRKNFKHLTKSLPSRRRQKIDAIKAELRDNMALCELRQAIGISQGTLAERLNVLQPAVAKIERRSDIRISSLRRLIEAMGGSLEVKARFPEGDVTITNYSEALKR